MTDTFDRTQLDGKDREQLSEIAAALGVKSISRMRKADLVDAIVSATAGAGRPRVERPRDAPPGPARSARRRRAATISPRSPTRKNALAPTERARRRHDADPPPPATVRQRQRRRTAASLAPTTGGDRPSTDATVAHDRARDAGAGTTITSPSTTTARQRRTAAARPRDDDGQGNRRRRRRAGPRPRASRRRAATAASAKVAASPRESREEFTGDLIDARRPARPARRGLRLPAHERLPRRPQRRVRLGVAGAPLRPAQGRLREGRDPPAREQREVPGARARRPHQRHDARRGAQPRALRRPHAAVPRLEAAARARRRPERDHRPHHRPDLADRKGPARPDRVAAEGGQDHDHQADRVLDRAQQPRDARDGAARRRASRRGHRHAAPRAARRGRRVDVRPSVRRALPRRRAHDRAGPASRRDGQGRRDHPRRHHPPRPRLQPRGAGVGPDHVGRCRLVGAVPAEEVLRCGAQRRGGRLAHDPRDRARSRPTRRWTR